MLGGDCVAGNVTRRHHKPRGGGKAGMLQLPSLGSSVSGSSAMPVAGTAQHKPRGLGQVKSREKQARPQEVEGLVGRRRWWERWLISCAVPAVWLGDVRWKMLMRTWAQVNVRRESQQLQQCEVRPFFVGETGN